MVMRASPAAAPRRPTARPDVIAIARAMKSAARAKPVQRRPTGEVARERLYELMCEIGALHNGQEVGWKAHVSRKLHIPYSTVITITLAGQRGELRSIRPETVDHAIASTGIPPEAFYDSEFRG